jgi:hypothetical protein
MYFFALSEGMWVGENLAERATRRRRRFRAPSRGERRGGGDWQAQGAGEHALHSERSSVARRARAFE